jgi:ribosomal protein L11
MESVMTAKAAQTYTLAVAVAPAGIRPKRFIKRIKKKSDKKKGRNFLPVFSPIFG